MNDSLKDLIRSLHCTWHLFEIQGHFAFLIAPAGKSSRRSGPWVWYAPTLRGQLPDPSHRFMFTRFLDAGISVAGVDVGESWGNMEGRSVYSALYERLVAEHGLSGLPCLLPQSRGGLMLYDWAAENARRVACIAGIYPVCDVRSWPGRDVMHTAFGMSEEEFASCLSEHNPVDRLAALAEADVPILHVHGDGDTVVPLESNSGELARRYRKLGGKAELVVVAGKGHEVGRDFFECRRLIDFVVQHAR